MPPKTVNQVVEQLVIMEKKINLISDSVEQHLREGSGVKADIVWLKWLVMGIAGGIMAEAAAVIMLFVTK